MSTGAKAFAARVKLPCRLFCDGEAVEVLGTAVSIDTGSAVLAIPEGVPQRPKLGDAVRLELELPVKKRVRVRGAWLCGRAWRRSLKCAMVPAR